MPDHKDLVEDSVVIDETLYHTGKTDVPQAIFTEDKGHIVGTRTLGNPGFANKWKGELLLSDQMQDLAWTSLGQLQIGRVTEVLVLVQALQLLNELVGLKAVREPVHGRQRIQQDCPRMGINIILKLLEELLRSRMVPISLHHQTREFVDDHVKRTLILDGLGQVNLDNFNSLLPAQLHEDQNI